MHHQLTRVASHTFLSRPGAQGGWACHSTRAAALFGRVCAAFPALLHVVLVSVTVQESEQQQGRDELHDTGIQQRSSSLHTPSATASLVSLSIPHAIFPQTYIALFTTLANDLPLLFLVLIKGFPKKK